jgi:hypothetical protein
LLAAWESSSCELDHLPRFVGSGGSGHPGEGSWDQWMHTVLPAAGLEERDTAASRGVRPRVANALSGLRSGWEHSVYGIARREMN